MSLINDMLQELDARGASPAMPKAVQVPVRPQQSRHSKTRQPLILAVIALPLVLYLLYLLWMTTHKEKPVPPMASSAVVTASPEPAPPAVLASLKMDIMLSKLPSLSAPIADAEPTSNTNNTINTSETSKAIEKVEVEPAKEVKLAKEAKPVPATAPTLAATPSSMQILPAASSPQQRAENEYRKANQALQHGRQTEALLALEQALNFDPQHHAARQTLVTSLVQTNRLDEAIKRLQQGLQVDAKQSLFASMLARLQAERGDLPTAIDTMYASLPQAGNQAEFQALLAALLQRDKRHQQAVNHYQLALKLQPENGVWWMGMAISLQADNRLSASVEAFLKAKNSSTLNPQLLAFVEQRLAQLQSANK